MFSSFPSIFETVENYRYSITIGLGLLFFVPMFIPIGWSTVWPFFQRTVWGRTRTQEQTYAEAVVRHCKEIGGKPPFEIDVSSLETENIDEEVLVEFLRAVTETDESIRLENQTIIVTKEGLETLKAYL